jgi:ammonia channel protein AmtB
VVHLCGGSISFMAALVIGPRYGKFVPGKEQEIQGHSVPVGIFVFVKKFKNLGATTQ